jgi:phage-related protein
MKTIVYAETAIKQMLKLPADVRRRLVVKLERTRRPAAAT